ncbi:MAG: hypothetical protein KA152_11825 [Verrucomicrobiales bacterium]|nr:hypothetical protein [Verrucomicrobiales bacterium]
MEKKKSVQRCLLLLVGILPFLAGCSREGTKKIPTVSDLKSADKVIGVRFEMPGEKENVSAASAFSLIGNDGEVDVRLLDRIGIKTAALNREQTSKLVAAVYGNHAETPAFLCYKPHHVFLFYDEDGELINTVEVCFDCIQIRTSPPVDETQPSGYDFKALALLCDEIGIGMSEGPLTSDDFVRWWDKEFDK